jgi:hypothetical protein
MLVIPSRVDGEGPLSCSLRYREVRRRPLTEEAI